jgi:hypothetical protein|tara:strand:- start:274 stop:1119 length:846 start_codon:yes stop_codon:yes gene_type:complete
LSRNNNQRSKPHGDVGSESIGALPNPLDFISPTEYVELPSKGKGYPSGHPLHDQETIEIKFMTAKEEDILSSRALLKKGIAIERLIESVICNKNIVANELLVGDRNAILIATRTSAYGNIYSTKVTCPNCATVTPCDFDLNAAIIYDGKGLEEYNIQITTKGLFKVVLPITKFEVEFRLLRGQDEIDMIKKSQKLSKNKVSEENITDQFRKFVVSVNGYGERSVIDHVAPKLPAQDSMFLRGAYKKCSPDIKISNDFTCPSCGNEQELEVPFGADFFWPNR